jgi:hypothetical protein
MLHVAQMARLAFVIASLAGTAANAHPELKFDQAETPGTCSFHCGRRSIPVVDKDLSATACSHLHWTWKAK